MCYREKFNKMKSLKFEFATDKLISYLSFAPAGFSIFASINKNVTKGYFEGARIDELHSDPEGCLPLKSQVS